MGQIGLAAAIASLRAELLAAMTEGDDSPFRFPIGQTQIEFHVGVTKSGETGGKVKFWVVELDGKGTYAAEEIQKITITLEPPVDVNGDPVKVTQGYDVKP
ncbi:hypothetical protein GT755_03560 [Herbidospora sp. NEAU-GS84]|uniref:Trypsin-co-occurring domain-containing protein n=1 Tax=Herbidospora solisilvae TaxID=2696284 RepID=A0A7C9JQN7_9ACTN|nr:MULTISPECIES: trypco2 family protein [Herbidospora]NAS20759.1 hypothetical protein [Herbidospora solisilvae]GLX93213.1 hypothetical protein Hesp01_11630 [Herbidospora sp. NBRC 101105]